MFRVIPFHGLCHIYFNVHSSVEYGPFLALYLFLFKWDTEEILEEHAEN